MTGETRPNKPELSYLVEVAHLPPEGAKYHVEADESACSALADRAGILAVKALSARFEVEPWRQSGIIVRGKITGTATQSCSVTLEPVNDEIDETVTLYFERDRKRQAENSGDDVVIDVFGDDPPEYLAEDQLDLGDIAAEHFLLALEPYPRAPGAELDDEFGDADTAESKRDDSPFAPLRALHDTEQSTD